MAAEKFDRELWLRQLTAAYDGELPYKNETEVINWLRHRSEATDDREERARLRKGIQFLLDQFASRMPQAKNAKPEQFVDLSLLQQLEKEGYFAEMAKRYP